jgi:hypothetical protein
MRDPGSMEIRMSARYLKLTAARPHQVNGAWLTPQRGADRPGPSLELRAAHLIGSSGGAVIACPERVVQKAHAGGHLREFADGCKRRRNPPFNGATAGGEVAPFSAVRRYNMERPSWNPVVRRWARPMTGWVGDQLSKQRRWTAAQQRAPDAPCRRTPATLPSTN